MRSVLDFDGLCSVLTASGPAVAQPVWMQAGGLCWPRVRNECVLFPWGMKKAHSPASALPTLYASEILQLLWDAVGREGSSAGSLQRKGGCGCCCLSAELTAGARATGTRG